MNPLRYMGITFRIMLLSTLLVFASFAVCSRLVPTERLPGLYLPFSLTFIAALFGAWIVGRSISVPLRRLGEDAARAAAGEGDAVALLDSSGADEVSSAAAAVADLAERYSRVRVENHTLRERVERYERSEGPEGEEAVELLEYSLALKRSGPFWESASYVLEKLNERMGLQWSSLFILDEKESRLYLVANAGLGHELMERLRAEGRISVQYEPGEGISGEALRSGSTVVVNSGHRDPRFRIFERFVSHYKSINTMCAVPVMEGEVRGLLCCFNKSSPPVFKQRDVAFLEKVARVFGVFLDTASAAASMYDDSGMMLPACWERRWSEEIERVRRKGGELAMVVFELVPVPDGAGLSEFPSLLKEVGALAASSLRLTDCIKREGRRFSVLLPQTGAVGAAFFSGRIREILERRAWEGGRKSFGYGMACAAWPEHAAVPEELHEVLEKSLSASLKHGDGRLVCAVAEERRGGSADVAGGGGETYE